MKKMKKNNCYCVLFLIAVIGTVSCKNKAERIIEGLWKIDTICYKGHEIRECFNPFGNVFFQNIFCRLPSIDNCNGLIARYRSGHWEVHKKNGGLILSIVTENRIFSGTYRMAFKRDSANKHLKMVFVSDSLYVSCVKFMFNCDYHQDLVNDLVEMSRVSNVSECPK